jgi:hypothetical protein
MSDVLLVYGDAWKWLERNKPEFILSDVPHQLLAPLNKFVETNRLVFINATSPTWLTGERQAQKRVEPYQGIVAAFPNVDTVCDPFLGWGPTALAALREGRNFVGIDHKLDRMQYVVEQIQLAHPAARIHTVGF